ncbi:MAG: hypothetical protein KC547_04830 [Anaerolineae bacterium]|nr:hypothetical protein [Anaerolineae bacterium]
MIDTYVRQLKSNDAGRRREAIIALGKSNDPAALPPLAEVYKNDPEPALRDLALKAGRYLRQHTQQEPPVAQEIAAAAPSSASSRLKEELASYEAEDASGSSSIPLQRRRVVPQEDIDRSKSYVDEALSHNMNGDNARALKALRKALELNPDIKDDGFFVSVAGAVTGDTGQAAINFILDQKQAKEFVKESKRQQKSVQTAMHLETAEKSRWSGVTLELAMFVLINVLGTLIMFFVFTESISSLSADSDMISGRQASELRSMVATFSLVTGLIVGLISAVGSAVNLFLQGVAIHFVATTLFGGKGTIRFMLDKLFGLYNKRLPLLYALIIASVWVTFGAGSPIFSALIGFVTSLIGLQILFKASSLTSQAYNFSTGSGCLTNILAFGFLGLISMVIGYLLTNVFLGSFLSSMGNLPLS